MKRLFFSLAILAIFGVLVSCTPSATIVNVEVVSAPDEVIVGDLDLSEFQIKISYSDDTFKYATFTVSMFSAEELAKFDVEGEQVISFSYQGIPGTITITITDLSSTMYTVVFKSGTEILKSEEVAEGEGATAPANPTKEGHTFKEWDKAFTNVTSNLEVNALFDVNTYTVTFKNGTETITTVTVNHGEGATAPASPVKEGYTFKEWDKAFTNVTSNLEVNAVFEEIIQTNKLSIIGTTGKPNDIISIPIWIDGNVFFSSYDIRILYNSLELQYVSHNAGENMQVFNVVEDGEIAFNYASIKNIENPQILVEINFKVIGTVSNTSSITFKEVTMAYITEDYDSLAVEYNMNNGNVIIDTEPIVLDEFTVKFYVDGVLVKEETVVEGFSATSPNDPIKEGYVFVGWDAPFTNIHNNIIINAIFEEISVSENTINIDSKTVSIGSTFTMNITIQGIVDFSSYDIRLVYDSTSLNLLSYTKGPKTDIVNTSLPNEIRFNYASVNNVDVETILLTLEFQVLATEAVELIISPYQVDISKVTSTYDVVLVNFKVINGIIKVE